MNRYLVLTIHTSNLAPLIVTEHRAFLDRLRSEGRMEVGGPFTDKSGGAYILWAESLEKAQSVAFGDPVHRTGSSKVTVYEWHAR